MNPGFKLKTSPKVRESIKVLLAIACWLFLASCTKTLYYDKIIPPELEPEVKPCRIAVVNLFDYTLPGLANRKYQKVYRTAIKKFDGGLIKNNLTDSLLYFFVADTLKQGYYPENLTVILPADSIKKMITGFESDYLLTIDSLSLFFETEEDHNQDPADGQTPPADTYLVADYYLSLYSASGNLIDRSEVGMSTFMSAVNYWRWPYDNLLTVNSKVLELTGELAGAAADDYIKKFHPASATEGKKIYTGRIFAESNDLILKREWDKAADLLQAIASGSNRIVAKRARHNLSVLNEVSRSITSEVREP
jgi:hypothetical protein